VDPTRGLTGTATPEIDEPRTEQSEACPRCASAEATAPVPIHHLDGRGFVRCLRCGCRRAVAPPPARASAVVVPGVELPFVEGAELIDPPDHRAPNPEAALVRAAEHEVRLALAARVVFVTDPEVQAYLDRLARETARVMGADLPQCRVLPFEEDRVRVLGLPSGDVLVSLGLLRQVQDEAELVFVLGHELEHVASGDAARRLVALGLASAARVSVAPAERWLQVASDLERLGHGTARELDADRQAFRALGSSGYDPRAALRHLERVEALLGQPGAGIAELGLAHPLPVDRRRGLERTWSAELATGSGRVNREVFRRVLVLGALEPCRPFGEPALTAPGSWRRRALLTAAGIALLAGLFLLVGLLLAR
jgi:hypothetical protein